MGNSGAGINPLSFFSGERGKAKQKKFFYSSELNSAVGEAGLADVAAVSGCPVGDVIEGLIFDRVLPKDQEARFYVVKVLADVQSEKEGRYCLRLALADIFSAEAAGPHENTRPLVELARDFLRGGPYSIDYRFFDESYRGNNPRNHMMGAWDSLCGRLEHLSKQDDFDFDLKNTAVWSRRYERALDSDDQFLLFNALDFILEQWGHLGSWSYTYRFLTSALAASQGWNETPADRIRFKEACEDVMASWDSNGSDAGREGSSGRADNKRPPALTPSIAKYREVRTSKHERYGTTMEIKSPRVSAPIGDDRLLGIQNVSDITGLCPTVASQLMDETGHAITLHSHKYVLQSSFMDFLRGREASQCQG